VRLELIQAPAMEPVTLAQAKLHLRVTSASEDALIERLIRAARLQVEATLRRKIVTQQWRIYFDQFPGVLCPDVAFVGRGAHFVLPDVAPVASINAVRYLDAEGVLQTLATSVYQLVKEAPARLVLAYGQAWPAARGDAESVRVELTCGYGAGNAVPEDITSAVLLLVGHWFENRETVNVGNITTLLPYSVEALLAPHIVAVF
jgi:uncharacterized phiE125 gp8 family phage protein